MDARLGKNGPGRNARFAGMKTTSRSDARPAKFVPGSKATNASQSPSVASLCFAKASHCKQWREKLQEHKIHFARAVPLRGRKSLV